MWKLPFNKWEITRVKTELKLTDNDIIVHNNKNWLIWIEIGDIIISKEKWYNLKNWYEETKFFITKPGHFSSYNKLSELLKVFPNIITK